MIKQNEKPGNFEDSDESWKNGSNNYDPIEENFIEPLSGKEELTRESNKDISKEQEEFASQEKVMAEIDKVFRKDREIMTKLLKYTETLIFGYTGQFTINGMNCEDIVMEAIDLILCLKRKWYSAKCPNIVVLIIGVIKSIIRNSVNKKDYKTESKIIPLFLADDDDKTGNSVYDDEMGKRFNKDDFDFEGNDDEEVLQKYLDLFKDDPVAYCVLDELLKTSDYDVKEQNQHLAKTLGITVTEVENAKKRIKYKLSFLKKPE